MLRAIRLNFNSFYVRTANLAVARVEFQQKSFSFLRHWTSTNNAVFQHTLQRISSQFSWIFFTREVWKVWIWRPWMWNSKVLCFLEVIIC